MHWLRLGWVTGPSPTLRAAWQDVTSTPAPAIPGLLARQWQLDRSQLEGCYLFARPADLEAFLADPDADPAFARLSRQVGTGAEPQLPVRIGGEPPRLGPALFIIAAPRSGSTLLFDLLSQAPGLWAQDGEGDGAIEGIPALHPARRGYESHRLIEDDATPGVVDLLRAGWLFGLRDRSGSRYLDLPVARRPAVPRWLDKTTEHSLRVAFLARACPDARFVFLHRDARQSVSSLIEAWQHGGFVKIRDLPGWARKDWCFLLPPGWRELNGQSLQAVATAQWQAANQVALHDLEMLEPERWTSIDYHELVAHPKDVVARLCRFAELEVDAQLLSMLDGPLPLSPTTVTPPSPIKWRSNPMLDAPALEWQVRYLSARLRTLTVPAAVSGAAPSRPSGSPESPRFACYLNDVPTTEEVHQEDLRIDPSFRFQLGASIPLGMATAVRHRDRFLDDQPILWTQDALTRMYKPYWVPRGHAHLYRAFEPGSHIPDLPQSLLNRLRAASIVATDEQRTAALGMASQAREQLAQAFAREQHCVIRSLLGPGHCSALARYYRQLIDTGRWSAGDEQVERRHGWHNESVARFFHHQLTSFVTAVAGEPVCASYVYVSAYQTGAELVPHLDRKQCEYTLSLVVDEIGGRSAAWPLWFLTGAGRRSVTLNVGDGVLFRGHELPHWREVAPGPQLALSTLLLHYVSASFSETLD